MLRTGVNTGQVATGTGEPLVTGDAVNIAARLEQAAPPGEVLLGQETYRLVRDAVEVEPAPPLTAKGKAEPLAAYRLLASGQAGPPRRRADGRAGAPKQAARGRVLERRRRPDLPALHGPRNRRSRQVASRRRVPERSRRRDLLRGRCLSYGEGISYWPVTEVVKQLVPDASAIGPLAAILGDDSAASSPDEIAWAVRKLLESRAAESPLVVVFDDAHWGEPTFLDLVEHVADLSRDAPILLLCMARPELLDPSGLGRWQAQRDERAARAARAEESVELIESLTAIDDELRGRILEAAGGNPLFVEEMVAMVPEDGGDVAVPPTIQALLAARLDQLDPPSGACSSAARSRARCSTAARSLHSRPTSAQSTAT